jgi:methionyl-tRNA formyltransferase
MPVKIAFFGQAPFAKDILVRLLDAGHEIVGVYTPPEGRRPDPLAEEAAGHGLRLLRHRYFRRRGGEAIESRVKEHAELGAELNVLAYVTAIIPPEIVDAPVHRSLCFHPSLLPRFRGGNAIPWQIILGEPETGVTVFQPDAGVDTGPIAVQKGGDRLGAARRGARPADPRLRSPARRPHDLARGRRAPLRRPARRRRLRRRAGHRDRGG